MKSIAGYLVCLVILASSLAAQPAGEARPLARHLTSNTDIELVAINENVAVERLRGQEALSHLHNLFSRKPQAFAAARRDLEARGFRPTDTVYVERTIRLAGYRGPQKGPVILKAQSYSEGNKDGEIVFWSWDDGDDGTWEGEIYMDVYSTGAASTWTGQIDCSTSEHSWVYYHKAWEGSDSGGPREVHNEMPPLPGTLTQAAPAVLSTGRPTGTVMFASFYRWAVCWRSAVVGGCGTAAAGCIRAGVGWPECFALWCVGAEVAGGVSCYLSN